MGVSKAQQRRERVEKRDAIIRELWCKIPGTEIAQILGMRPDSIYKRARQIGLPNSPGYKTKEPDEFDLERDAVRGTQKLERAYVAWARKRGYRVWEYRR